LLRIRDLLRPVAVHAPYPALAVAARKAHVGTVHSTGRALTAAAAHGENREVTGLHGSHGAPGFRHLPEHLVAYHQLPARLWRPRAAARRLFAVSAADADLQHPDLDVLCGCDARLGDIGKPKRCGAGREDYRFHTGMSFMIAPLKRGRAKEGVRRDGFSLRENIFPPNIGGL
jgi:hypothetical protein